MIPKNITQKEILSAIRQIDDEGIPRERLSRTYYIKYDGKYYPPKYVISLADSKLNGKELNPADFSGGYESNKFLSKLGFEIVPYSEYLKSTEHHNDKLKITTVSVESTSEYNFNTDSYEVFNNNRISLAKKVLSEIGDSDIYLFPAGFLEFEDFSDEIVTILAGLMSDLLSKNSSAVLCFGEDSNNGNDQLAVAVNRDGIAAVGRKFYPTDGEKGCINTAPSFDCKEMGYNRSFNVKDKKIYMAVCYDCFGLRHKSIKNPKYDVILTLAHRFHKKGEGPSGDVDFARKGLAGASSQWNCPVFGTATFFDRKVPPAWPTGIYWSSSNISVKNFKYADNELKPTARREIKHSPEAAVCYDYIL